MARTPGGSLPRLDVVLLAGGRGARLGGIDKADLELGGRRLLDRALDAVQEALAPAVTLGTIVVVGAVAVPQGVRCTQEDPPYGGPIAGLAAGVVALGERTGALPAPWCLVLASDVADPAIGLSRLGAAVAAASESAEPGDCAEPAESGESGESDTDGYWLVDQSDRPQWLFAIYRRTALLRALAGPVRDRSARSTLGSLQCTGLPVEDGVVADIDTWADIAGWTLRNAAVADDR